LIEEIRAGTGSHAKEAYIVEFKAIDPFSITDNVFELIGDKWMLITAGNRESFNTMTASWGGRGVSWGKKVCFCLVRPGRYTYQFMESSDSFTLSFYDERHRKALEYCGSHSGRDVDKVKETDLTPVLDDKGIYFAEARLVFFLKKLYFQDIDPAHFLDTTIGPTHYPLKDYHRMYIGEILACLVRSD
jgi:flavin reductase (DIM6/NTAB) family NADH-FMN oxidoreductase RutF